MRLTPMRYKTFVWPYNPRVYEIDYKRNVAVHKVPFGYYALQDMGRTCRVMKGEGEFCGASAYALFGRLACLFYEGTPGVLVHPLWQTASAYLVELSLRQEPTENYVAYSFEFWEDYTGYETGAKLVSSAKTASASAEAVSAAAPDGGLRRKGASRFRAGPRARPRCARARPQPGGRPRPRRCRESAGA